MKKFYIVHIDLDQTEVAKNMGIFKAYFNFPMFGADARITANLEQECFLLVKDVSGVSKEVPLPLGGYTVGFAYTLQWISDSPTHVRLLMEQWFQPGVMFFDFDAKTSVEHRMVTYYLRANETECTTSAADGGLRYRIRYKGKGKYYWW